MSAKAENISTMTVGLEIKQLKGREFSGYGSTFGNVDYGGDMVVAGAFAKSLQTYKNSGTMPPMFWMHDAAQVPGKWLSMEEDDNGLFVKGVLAQTPLGDEVYTLLKMDAVRGMSIGYITKEADYNNDGVRILKEVDLIENSIVSLPMNPRAQIANVKSLLASEVAEYKRNLEKFVRAQGFSKSAARNAAHEVFGDLGETPKDPITDYLKSSGERLDDLMTDCDGVTPDVIELRTGLSDLSEKLLADDIAAIYRRYIK